MRLAAALAQSALHITAPNPRVGCVIATPQGRILGQGHTQAAGQAHAEIMALEQAQAQGFNVAGATAYVTMEPCAHHGRTGPCCEALVAANIKKVVASIADPNPLVAGRGFERLRAAGIDVEVGLGAQEARALNIGFFSRMLRQRPWVRMKIASSLDGKTALNNQQSQWITDQEARVHGHAWRARSCAVLTGIGTVLSDNPKLDVRLLDTPRQPQLVVLDSQLRTPENAAIFIAKRPVLIYTQSTNGAKKTALQNQGAQVVTLPNDQQHVDLTFVMQDLAARGMNELHVEAGAKLNGALLDAGLVDELLIYMAPKLLGTAQEMLSWDPLQNLSQAVHLQWISTQMLGNDLFLHAKVANQAAF